MSLHKITTKLYETESYLKELKTKITECSREGDSVYIKLQETIFFPEEGGQYSDTGEIISIDDGSPQENRPPIHILKGELLGSPTEGETDIRYLVDGELEEGTEVLLKLDWQKRFSRMQNHSGEHILSGLIHAKYGLDNVGFHLSDDEPVTLTFNGILSEEQVAEIESMANQVIYENLPITDSYPSKEELESLSYRSKLDIKAQVRIITVGEKDRIIDVCACCAPHVSKTGAIGLIKIISAIKFKGGTQLSILCGKRAYEYINRNLEALNKTCRIFSTNSSDLPQIAGKLKEERDLLNARIAALTEELIINDVKAGVYENLVFTDMELTAVNMKNIYNALTELKDGWCGIFAGNDEKGYRYYAGGKSLDARLLAQEMKNRLDAKGGGSAEMIQGKTSATKDRLENFFRELR